MTTLLEIVRASVKFPEEVASLEARLLEITDSPVDAEFIRDGLASVKEHIRSCRTDDEKQVAHG